MKTLETTQRSPWIFMRIIERRRVENVLIPYEKSKIHRCQISSFRIKLKMGNPFFSPFLPQNLIKVFTWFTFVTVFIDVTRDSLRFISCFVILFFFSFFYFFFHVIFSVLIIFLQFFCSIIPGFMFLVEKRFFFFRTVANCIKFNFK